MEKGELKLIPEKQKATWFRWLGPENIRHWCISRQLWWGHRIPAYLIKVAGEGEPDSSNDANWVVARTAEEVRGKSGVVIHASSISTVWWSLSP